MSRLWIGSVERVAVMGEEKAVFGLALLFMTDLSSKSSGCVFLIAHIGQAEGKHEAVKSKAELSCVHLNLHQFLSRTFV